MTDPRLADHQMGLELELVELVEQRRRAEVQGRSQDATDLQRRIDAVQLELAATAEHMAGSVPTPIVMFHDDRAGAI